MLTLSLAVSPLEVELRDLVDLYDIIIICLIQYSHKICFFSNKHKAIGAWHWAVEKLQERAAKPTVTFYSSVETIAGESKGTDCYLALFAYRMIRCVVAVMV